LESIAFWLEDLVAKKSYITLSGNTVAAEFAKTFKDFLRRQEAASFTIDDALQKMAAAGTGGKTAVAKAA
jgi:hypothetical protein